MVRIGFVGSGLIAWTHALGLKAMIDAGVLNAEITAVYDPRQRRAEAFAEAVGSPGANAVAGARDVADRADAVFVCTPTGARSWRCRRGDRRGPGAVLREASRSWTSPGATALVEAVEESGMPSPVRAGAAQCACLPGACASSWPSPAAWGEPMAAVFRDDQFFPIRGHYASRWRADVDPGGRRLPDRALHPRRRHPALLLRRGRHGRCADGQPRRTRRESRTWPVSRCPSRPASRRNSPASGTTS